MASYMTLIGVHWPMHLMHPKQGPITTTYIHVHDMYICTHKAALMQYVFLVPQPSPPLPVSPVCHTSPVVVDYMRSLPHRSPWKSPLSKYRRLKQRSPHKRISPKRLKFPLHQKSSHGQGFSTHTSMCMYIHVHVQLAWITSSYEVLCADTKHILQAE